MDAAILLKAIHTRNEKILRQKKASRESFNENNGFLGMGGLFSMLIGIWAAYLSWECNTKHNMNIFLKLLWALGAYIFGFIYLIYYFFFRYDSCVGSTGGPTIQLYSASPNVGPAPLR